MKRKRGIAPSEGAVFEFKDAQPAYTLAERKARYSHRDWIVWTDGSQYKSAMVLLKTLERALGDIGPTGKMMLIQASSGVNHRISYGMGQFMLGNARVGAWSDRR